MRFTSKSFHPRSAMTLVGSACFLSSALVTAHAADVSWATYGANTSGVLAPGIIGAPDGASATFPWEAAKFTDRRSYASLAATMGLAEAQLSSYDVLAWEANGGHSAASGGWESAHWRFSDGASASISSTFNELTGGSSNPSVIFKTGSITGAAYNAVFGTSVPAGEVRSWLLVALPSSVNAHSPSFRIDFLPAGGGVGLGEGTPDPDAIGVLAAVPEPSTWALMGAGLGVLAWRRLKIARR